jgi:AAA domain
MPWKSRLCSEVRSTTLEWLWPRYLARGKLALFDGDPEMAKSLVTIDLIARLSRGSPLPDGTPLPRAYTSILLSAEDDEKDTIRPRAEAAGADLDRLVLPDFGDELPRFPDDVPALTELVVDHTADLVVIDPFTAFLPPNVPANLDQYVRLVLNPLAALAAWTGCGIVLIRHLTKKASDRAILSGQGSMAFMARVRTALFAAAHPGRAQSAPLDSPIAPTSGPAPAQAGTPTVSPDCVLAVSKSNVGRRPPALGYRVVESPSGAPVINWTGPVDLTADDLCTRKAPTGLKAHDRAIDWLRRELADGPRKSADIYAAAAEAGIPERTLQRAKDWLWAKSHRLHDRKADRSEWWWYDPAAPWPKSAPFKKPDPFELPPLEF